MPNERWTAAFVCALCAFAALGLGCGLEPDAADPPNIVLIIGDDHGWPYFGFMGNPVVETPHLDDLAHEGVLFPHAFNTASTCRPSLMTLLTGLHPIQWNTKLKTLRTQGIRRHRDARILDFATLPRLLGTHGYRTFQGGKYWEGAYANAGFDAGTKDLESDGPDNPPTIGLSFHRTVQRNAGGTGLSLGRETMQPLWDFLLRDDDRPFFVWFAPKLPHTPHDAPETYQRRYADRDLSPAAQRYYANITRFDDRVGELVAFLDEHELRSDTLLVYLSDNGWQQDATDAVLIRSLGGPQGKASMHDLGFRTPLVFNWPGRVPAGAVREDIVSTVDLFPTLLAFAGIDPPSDRTGLDLHDRVYGHEQPTRTAAFGTSSRQLRPPLQTELETRPPVQSMRKEQAYFIRTDRWRYIWYVDAARFSDRTEDELYQIDRDPRETRNVAAQHPQQIAEFRRQILHWIDATTVPFSPRPSETY